MLSKFIFSFFNYDTFNHFSGVMNAHGMVNFGRRWSSFKAFLEPAMPWKNLHIATLAKVHKVNSCIV